MALWYRIPAKIPVSGEGKIPKNFSLPSSSRLSEIES